VEGASGGAKVSKITEQDVYNALFSELNHPSGYITERPLTLDSVNVDGTVSCASIAEFLNERLGVRAVEPKEKR
jgi:hypothetical protein